MLCMLNIIPLEKTNMDRRGRRTWKQANSVCVGLNMTAKTVAGTWSQSIGNVELEQEGLEPEPQNTNKENSRKLREQTACMSA